LRNGSVEADFTRTGAGGAMLVDDDCRVDNDDDCCVVGEVIGAFMLAATMWCFLLYDRDSGRKQGRDEREGESATGSPERLAIRMERKIRSAAWSSNKVGRAVRGQLCGQQMLYHQRQE
jgi:hypothetical protein